MEQVGFSGRFEAIPALETIRTAEAFETLVEWLRHRDEENRETGRRESEKDRR